MLNSCIPSVPDGHLCLCAVLEDVVEDLIHLPDLVMLSFEITNSALHFGSCLQWLKFVSLEDQDPAQEILDDYFILHQLLTEFQMNTLIWNE